MNKLKNLYFPLSDISKNRTLLMGYAILFIMLMHATSSWIPFESHLIKRSITFPCSLVHTAGFLFLSGFGLYYSLSKSTDLLPFYKKRALRVWLPYAIISLPFYLTYLIVGKYTFIEFLGNWTAIGYFFNGGGLWYISVSLLLYAVAPLIYRGIYQSGGGYIL